MKVAIIGSGIAGLATAIALKLRGIDAEVYERSTQFREVGAGLQISPNGMKVLDALGVVLSEISEPQSIMMKRGESGRLVFSLAIKDVARIRWGAPFVHIHRADLHSALLDRVMALDIPINLGTTISSSELTSLHADHIIGADGVSSSTRKLYNQRDSVIYSGQVAYRSVVPAASLNVALPPTSVIWAGHKKHAVTYRIRGGNFVNFVGICEESTWREEGWNHDIDPALVRETFSDFDPIIQDVLSQTESMKRWALLYHPELPSFTHETISLVGDAAHPMLPSFAQGAVQALEDAYAIAAALAANKLELYDQIRKKRVARIQMESRKNLEFYHQGAFGRAMFFSGASILDRFSPKTLLRRLDWLYGYDVREEIRSYI